MSPIAKPDHDFELLANILYVESVRQRTNCRRSDSLHVMEQQRCSECGGLVADPPEHNERIVFLRKKSGILIMSSSEIPLHECASLTASDRQLIAEAIRLLANDDLLG